MDLAELLAAAGERDEAVRQAAAALQREPDNAAALALVAQRHGARDAVGRSPSSASDPADTPEGSKRRAPEPADAEAEALRRLDSELSEIAAPMYVEGEPEPATDGYDVEPARGTPGGRRRHGGGQGAPGGRGARADAPPRAWPPVAALIARLLLWRQARAARA